MVQNGQTTLKIDKETLKRFHTEKPDGMSNALYLRRLIDEKKQLTELVEGLKKELTETRGAFTHLALQKREVSAP